MIGLDTNVLVRYLVQDDDVQSPLATQAIESLDVDSPGFLSLVTIVETAWVLARAYKLDRTEIATALDTMLRSRELVVDRADDVLRALRAYESSSADFADCLIVSISDRVGCSATLTFDTKAAKSARMTLLSA